MNARSLRFVRGWSASIFATTAAACSHGIGGGTFPFGVAFVLALVFSAMICTALAGKGLSWLRLGIAVGVSQSLFHGLFALLGDTGFARHATMPVGHHHQLFAVPTGSTAPVVAGLDLGMLIAHLCAAVLTVVAFRRGEAVARRFIKILTLLLRPLFGAAFAMVPARQTHPRVAAHRRVAAFSSRDIFLRTHYRGPPAASPFH